MPRVPTVLSPAEVARVIERVPQRHNYRLTAKLLYGTGLRVSEADETVRAADDDFAIPRRDAAVLEAPDSKAGGVMACPECEQKMQVPEAPAGTVT